MVWRTQGSGGQTILRGRDVRTLSSDGKEQVLERTVNSSTRTVHLHLVMQRMQWFSPVKTSLRTAEVVTRAVFANT
jgi:hypothetical protein